MVPILLQTFNRAEYSLQVISAIKNYIQYPHHLIVIDNASSDDSEELIGHKSFSALKIKYIQNSANFGLPKAVNQGLNVATGDYILFLNPDARIPPDFFTKSLQLFQDFPDAGIMGPELVDPDGTVQGSVFKEPSIVATFREFWLKERGLTAKYTPLGPDPVPVNAVSGACMFFPRHTLDLVGLFTEKVFMYYEDLDYCRRIRLAGWKIYFNPRIKVLHEHGQSSLKSGGKTAQYIKTSSIWYNGWLKHWLMYLITRSGRMLTSS